ncbi:MAG TPA: hypothetical protein VNH18_29420 [Bryobacteraceae bacterium]|nr:hypothetical protein [Bryobacteraceae bacterium]
MRRGQIRQGIIHTAIAATALFQLGMVASAQGPKYVLVDLGTNTSAVGINDSGQVAGTFVNPDGVRAFRTAPNSKINPTTDDLGPGVVAGINKFGQVAGSTDKGPFRTAPNSPINPATDNLGTAGSFAITVVTALNDSGQVVGYGFTGGGHGEARAFRTAPNSPINPALDLLGTLAGRFTWGYAINNSGQVTGVSDLVDSGSPFFNILVEHAFRTDAAPTNPVLHDLGTLGGSSSVGYGINNSGQVVGASSTGSSNLSWHAFRTAANSPIHPSTDDLGTLGGSSTARAINDSGQVVGDSFTSDARQHAFVYTNGMMYDLNQLIPSGSGWELAEAVDINTSGQIVANGQGHAFRLDPVVIKVSIEIKAHTSPVTINPKSSGKIPVAVLSAPTFDATVRVDRKTLTFGRAGGEESLAFCTAPEDVNHDGLLDLVCHFDTDRTGFQSGDTRAVLKARTLDGIAIEGRALVRIIQ